MAALGPIDYLKAGIVQRNQQPLAPSVRLGEAFCRTRGMVRRQSYVARTGEAEAHRISEQKHKGNELPGFLLPRNCVIRSVEQSARQWCRVASQVFCQCRLPKKSDL